MGLPDISGYLAATRQPIDLVGPAIAAFQAVSSEMRATRAQNLAEEESARDLGKGIKEGMQNDRMFEEDIIDKRLNRQIALEDQDFERQRLGFEAMRVGMDMRQQEFEMQNLMPLEMQERSLAIARQQQMFDAAAYEMDNEMRTIDLVRGNLSTTAGLIDGRLPVPEEAIDVEAGETADSPVARVRAVHNALRQIKPMVDSAKNPGLTSIYQSQDRALQAQPGYSAMAAGNKLMLPAERKAQRAEREKYFHASIPGTDAWSANWITLNRRSVDTLLDAPEAEYGKLRTTLVGRAESDHKAFQEGMNPGPPKVDHVAQRQRFDTLARARADVEATRVAKEAAEKSGYPRAAKEAAVEYDAAAARLKSLEGSFGGIVPGVPTPETVAPVGGNPYDSYFRR